MYRTKRGRQTLRPPLQTKSLLNARSKRNPSSTSALVLLSLSSSKLDTLLLPSLCPSSHASPAIFAESIVCTMKISTGKCMSWEKKKNHFGMALTHRFTLSMKVGLLASQIQNATIGVHPSRRSLLAGKENAREETSR